MSRRNLYIRFLLAFFFLSLFLSASYESFSEVRKSECQEENQCKKQQKEKELPSIQVLSLQVIVPVIKGDLPSLSFSDVLKPIIIISENIQLDVFEPYTSSRFFKKLFTCIISVNAP